MKIRILEFGLFLKVLSKCIKDYIVKAVSICFYNLGDWEHFVLKYDRIGEITWLSQKFVSYSYENLTIKNEFIDVTVCKMVHFQFPKFMVKLM